MNPRVKSVKPLCDYQLLLEFTNDEVGIYDCKPLLNFGVFKELQNINYFNQVSVIGDSVTWIKEQDICPDTLYLESTKMDEITAIWYQLITDINNSTELCSSESALVGHFACRLKEKYQNKIKLDFEVPLFTDKALKLDLYAKLNNKEIGFEIKLPKNSSNGNPNTGDRQKIINDIRRLFWLKENSKIDKGYFLCTTSALPFINKGRKKLFDTYQQTHYKQGDSFTVPAQSSVELNNIPHNFCFHWNGIIYNGTKYILASNITYAWLTPIII